MRTGMGMEDFMFDVFPGIFMTLWVILFGGFMIMFFVSIGKSTAQWKKNNDSPRLNVAAKVVAKRNEIHRGAGEHHHTYTHYFVTFEVNSGDRMELEVKGNEFGMLVEGDYGQLTFQGTRYLGFERRSI